MKLKELNENIATACEMRPKAVAAVQAETFRQMRAVFEKGERIQIPEFGVFSVKDVAGEEGRPGKKVVRFKLRAEAGEEEGQDAGGKRKGGKRKKVRAAESAEAAESPAPDEDEDEADGE
jgi:nucleoid DNA-binding protein